MRQRHFLSLSFQVFAARAFVTHHGSNWTKEFRVIGFENGARVTQSDDGSITVSVPPGNFDLWKGEENGAPRLVTNVDDPSFEFEVTWSGSATRPLEFVAIIVQRNLDEFVRFSYQLTAAGKHRLFAAYVKGNSADMFLRKECRDGAPNRLRVSRIRGDFSFSSALPGADFTEQVYYPCLMQAAAVGLAAGHTGDDKQVFEATATSISYHALEDQLPDPEPRPTDPSLLSSPTFEFW